jgi:hypothetical protein
LARFDLQVPWEYELDGQKHKAQWSKEIHADRIPVVGDRIAIEMLPEKSGGRGMSYSPEVKQVTFWAESTARDDDYSATVVLEPVKEVEFSSQVLEGSGFVRLTELEA